MGGELPVRIEILCVIIEEIRRSLWSQLRVIPHIRIGKGGKVETIIARTGIARTGITLQLIESITSQHLHTTRSITGWKLSNHSCQFGRIAGKVDQVWIASQSIV